MSGHSKWSTIKRKKGVADAKRGQIFTRLIREIMVAAKLGGGDPDRNSRLRTAIDSAKVQNMPKENIDRAIKKGIGELGGINYEEIIYEAYAPGGIAFLIEVMTDNKKRAAADIRYILNKQGGTLAKVGSVAYLFENKGIITLIKDRDKDKEEDKLMELVLEFGAEDVREEGENWEIYCSPEKFSFIVDSFKKAGLTFKTAEITKVPYTSILITDLIEANRIIKFMDALDDYDDVQHVYANFDIDDNLLIALEN